MEPQDRNLHPERVHRKWQPLEDVGGRAEHCQLDHNEGQTEHSRRRDDGQDQRSGPHAALMALTSNEALDMVIGAGKGAARHTQVNRSRLVDYATLRAGQRRRLVASKACGSRWTGA